MYFITSANHCVYSSSVFSGTSRGTQLVHAPSYSPKFFHFPEVLDDYISRHPFNAYEASEHPRMQNLGCATGITCESVVSISFTTKSTRFLLLRFDSSSRYAVFVSNLAAGFLLFNLAQTYVQKINYRHTNRIFSPITVDSAQFAPRIIRTFCSI